ncbi:MAG: homocysteine S-methyltransferase family protein [Desulfobulbaceae bacterium]|nr:MAG: homocysteine S-methyltransferase family protein [Desulfobulbaceae bacterium]
MTILDGGMGREILRMGAPFGQPEWSALCLMKTPHLVKRAHESFAQAGCHVLTTSNYAVVPFHIGKDRFDNEGTGLTRLAGQLAREVAAVHDCRVAGSIPPLYGSYRPDLFNPEGAQLPLQKITAALEPFVDFWLGETISSIAEVEVIAKALPKDNRERWYSFTLQDGLVDLVHGGCLRSGELIKDGVAAAVDHGASAVLFNCSQPEVMAPAVETAVQQAQKLGAKLRVGVYANAFPPMPKDSQANSSLSEIRDDLDPNGYLQFAGAWKDLGATIIGGCCGIGPEHIKLLRQNLVST